MLEQISIYTENKKGVLRDITSIFVQNQINIDAMIVNDSAEFGTARFIVDKPEAAAEALKSRGYVTKKTKVVGVYVGDGCGELDRLLEYVLDANINLDYIYASFDRATAAPVVIMKSAGDVDILESILRSKGYTVR